MFFLLRTRRFLHIYLFCSLFQFYSAFRCVSANRIAAGVVTVPTVRLSAVILYIPRKPRTHKAVISAHSYH